jgi:hypothetical protein
MSKMSSERNKDVLDENKQIAVRRTADEDLEVIAAGKLTCHIIVFMLANYRR